MFAFSTAWAAQPTALVRGEERRAIEVLTRAFASDPPARWLYPDEREYRTHFPAFARGMGGSAIADGTGLASSDRAGVALWLAPGSGPDEKALAGLMEASVPEPRRGHVLALIEEMGRVHPTEPHWYLPLIGVEPGRQGSGIGSALLRPVLETCDATDVPAYLEASTARNVALYRQHGFEAVGEIQVGDCPPIVPMWRVPGSSGL